MERRDFLRRTAAGGLAAALAGPAAADHGEENPTPVDGAEAYEAKVTDLRYPLAGVPAIEAAGDTLRVELARGPDIGAPSAELVPSFGVGDPVTLELAAVLGRRESTIWNAAEGEEASLLAARFEIPETSRTFSPGLYDLRVSWDGGRDRQPRAVRVCETVPEAPTVVAIADPQLGDPRYLATGAEEASDEQSPQPFVDHARKGTGTPTERWGATRRAIAEVNAVDPDFVLFAGDLTFGQDVPGKYYAEYEDAWDVLNQLRVPSYCTMGNHDGYVQSGVDGKALYRQTFGPPSYSVDVGDIHVVAVDTYDWSYLDRLGGSVAVSTYGGQVREPQLEWLRRDLSRWRTDHDGPIVAFGHHNPSWQPDPVNRVYDETDGRPVLEQFGRGSRYPESGQLWTGLNLFALRQLLDDHDVTAFFSGHSHRDRLARTVREGAGPADVAETHAPRTSSPGYHYVGYTGRPEGDDEYDDVSVTVDPDGRGDGTIVDHLRNGDGTLYVGVTTTQSSTGEYWGWRPLQLDTRGAGPGGTHLDPADFGYPWSTEGEAALDERAVTPGAWTVDQDDVGLYSHPTYRLAVTPVTDTPDRVALDVENELAVPVDGAVHVTLRDSPGLHVEGADIGWRRHAGTQQTAKLTYHADGTSTHRIVAETRGPDRTPPG